MKINDPRFNLRELAKQLILLEEHLLERGKYCPDCITKHLLTIEALADEGQCLDTSGSLCPHFEHLQHYAQDWCRMFSRGVDPRAIGQQVRVVRKALAQHVLDPEPVQVKLAVRNPPTAASSSLGLTALLFPAAVGVGLYWLAHRTPRPEQH